jgi:hypothetical protein
MATTSNLLSVYSFSDYIALFALLVSFMALAWNILRDIVIDRIKLNLEATAGEILLVAGMPGRGAFKDADAEPEKVIENPKVAFTITNIGRRPVMVAKIGGDYIKPHEPDKKYWLLNTRELPKMLLPYERHIEIADKGKLLFDIKNNNVSKIFVQDTKGKKWFLSKKGVERLKKTITFIKI